MKTLICRQLCEVILVASVAVGAACGDVSPESRESRQSISPGSHTLHRQLAYGDFDADGRGDWAAGFVSNKTDCGAGRVHVWYQQFDRQHPTETWQSNGVGIFDNQNCGANFGASVTSTQIASVAMYAMTSPSGYQAPIRRSRAAQTR